MYTVYDFINNDIEPKHLRFGWKVEILPHIGLRCSEIALRYTCLNFDWKSLDYLNDKIYNMFLSSSSYKGMKEKMDKAMLKHKRLYFAAFSIEDLRYMVENSGLKINIDKLIDTAIKKRSEKIKEKLVEKSSLQESRNVI